jgi:hypothetical protein
VPLPPRVPPHTQPRAGLTRGHPLRSAERRGFLLVVTAVTALICPRQEMPPASAPTDDAESPAPPWFKQHNRRMRTLALRKAREEADD